MPSNHLLWSAYSSLFPISAPQVVLVNIDSNSMADYGPTESWPRTLYATVVDELNAAGASAVGVDIDFSETRAEDAGLAEAFSSPNVVLAAPPIADVTAAGAQQAWQAKRGISALSRGFGGGVYEFQTGYPTEQGDLAPSFAWELAKAAGYDTPLDTEPRTLLYPNSSTATLNRLSFRDVAQGQFRYADVQGKAVVIGAASDRDGFFSSTFGSVGSEGQVRAVASLIHGPPLGLPRLLTALLGALLGAGTFALGRRYSLVPVVLMPFIGLLFWKFGVALPAVTFLYVALFAALLATGVAIMNAFARKRQTAALGNRPAFARALESLSGGHHQHVAAALVYLPGYNTVLEEEGEDAAEEALLGLLQQSTALREKYPNMSGMGFRWSADELVILLEPVADEGAEREAKQLLLGAAQASPWGTTLSAEVVVSRVSTIGAGEYVPSDLVDELRYRLLAADHSPA